MRSLHLAVLIGAVLPWAAPCLAHPRAECAATRFDYGERLPGVLPPAPFVLANRGDTALVLRPQPCCGMGIAGAETPIPPGATRRLVVAAPHPVGDGLYRKTVRVLTNDPDRPVLQLELVATVKSPIQVFPGDELTFPLDSEEPVPQRVVLRCNDEPELKITSIRCSAPYIHCREIDPDLVMTGLNRLKIGIPDGEAPSRRRAVEVSATAGAPSTPYEAVVVLGTNCKRRPEVKLHVFGLSPLAVTAQPPRLDFDPLPRDADSASRVVTLTRAMGPFKVLGVTASDPRMAVGIHMDPTGLFGDLTATFRPGAERGAFQGTITIRTDDPQRPRIVLPYAGTAE